MPPGRKIPGAGPDLRRSIAAIQTWMDSLVAPPGPLDDKLRKKLYRDVPATRHVLVALIDDDPQHAAAAFDRLTQHLWNQSRLPPEERTAIKNPAAYLKQVLRNVERVERKSREIPTAQTEFPDVAEEGPSPYGKQEISQALDAAADAGELALVKTAGVWLNLCDELGRSPTSREVADELRISHQTVLNRLAALRTFVSEG